MKFIALAQIFTACAVVAAVPNKSHLRKLAVDESSSFLQAKPEDERCADGTWDCTCRDGSSCTKTTQCTNRGASGSCEMRISNPTNNENLSCRNGASCTNYCEDGSACKERNGNDLPAFLEAKPEDPKCADGTWDCTCRDGSSCKKTDQCTNRGVGGSCDRRVGSPDKSGKLSCRNGNSCINNNTACEDGSKCKERNGFLAFNRNLDVSEAVAVEAKPESQKCEDGTLNCTCRDGTSCKTTQQCINRNVGGSCSYRPPNRNSNMSCRNGESCIKNNTACADGSKCKERNGFLVSA